MMVVDKSPVENHAAMRPERAGDHIRRVGMCAAIGRRTRASLGVGFDYKSAEVGNLPVDLIHLFTPPLGHARIQRVERLQPSDYFRTAQIHRHRKLHAPRAENVRDPPHLSDEVILERSRSNTYSATK